MSTPDRLRELVQAAPPRPWDVTGGYPQRVTNGAATLIAEIFDDPDSPPTSAPLIALAPELAAWAADAAEELAGIGYWDVATDKWRCPNCEVLADAAHDPDCTVGRLLARLDGLLPEGGE